MSDAETLKRQMEAAQTLLANLRDIIGDDEQAQTDAIEGETGLFEAMADAAKRIGEIQAHLEGLDAYAGRMKTRKERLERQEDLIRTALMHAMSIAHLKTLELPTATMTLKATGPSVVITDEADIPAEFWKPQAPKLDKKLLMAALKDKKEIPGAQLSNGGETIQIRQV